MEVEDGEVIEFVPLDSSNERYTLSDGNDNRITDKSFDQYGEALRERQKKLDTGEFETVRVVRIYNWDE